MKKQIITITTILFIGMSAFAQPPKVNDQAQTGTDLDGHTTNITNPMNSSSGPVGTATALLVSLGAGAVAYKIRNNKKREN